MARNNASLVVRERIHLQLLRAYIENSLVELEQVDMSLREQFHRHMQFRIDSYKYSMRDDGSYSVEIDYLWLQ
jgi:hypothetical protein